MKDVTPKQIAVLYVLVCLLVIVAAVKYLILPANDKYKEEQQKYEVVDAEYKQLQIQSSYASIYETRNLELLNSINEIKNNFQSVVPGEDLDRLITDLIYKNSMKVQLLHINDPIPFIPKVSDSAEDENNTDGQTADSTSTTTTTTTTTTTATDAGDQVNTKDDQTQNQKVKVSQINVTVNGKYANFVKLLNDIKATKGMTVYDVNFSTEDDTSPMSNIVVSLIINVYMYDENNG